VNTSSTDDTAASATTTIPASPRKYHCEWQHQTVKQTKDSPDWYCDIVYETDLLFPKSAAGGSYSALNGWVLWLGEVNDFRKFRCNQKASATRQFLAPAAFEKFFTF
jgi:hypothetical protein